MMMKALLGTTQSFRIPPFSKTNGVLKLKSIKKSHSSVCLSSFLLLLGGPVQVPLGVPITERPGIHLWTWAGRETWPRR